METRLMNRTDRFVNSLTSLTLIMAIFSVGAFIDQEKGMAFGLMFFSIGVWLISTFVSAGNDD